MQVRRAPSMPRRTVAPRTLLRGHARGFISVRRPWRRRGPGPGPRSPRASRCSRARGMTQATLGVTTHRQPVGRPPRLRALRVRRGQPRHDVPEGARRPGLSARPRAGRGSPARDVIPLRQRKVATPTCDLVPAVACWNPMPEPIALDDHRAVDRTTAGETTRWLPAGSSSASRSNRRPARGTDLGDARSSALPDILRDLHTSTCSRSPLDRRRLHPRRDRALAQRRHGSPGPGRPGAACAAGFALFTARLHRLRLAPTGLPCLIGGPARPGASVARA